LLALRLKPGSKILLPNYICNVVLHPIRALGLGYKFYPIDENFNPEWNELEKIVGPNISSILMVHFFGQPQNVDLFKAFCKKHKLKLIEDNAHGYGGTIDGKNMGTFGDIGISSPRKNIKNLYSGGILTINSKYFLNFPDIKKYKPSISQRFKFLVSKIPEKNLKNFSKSFKNRPKYENPLEFNEKEILDLQIDSKSRNIIKSLDISKLKKNRREKFNEYKDLAIKNNLKPVIFSLSEDSNPWCFPAYTRGINDSIKWFDWGWKNNINIYSWPTLPSEVLKDSKVLSRWNRLICFQIK
tara:strand:+ start:568 stop:1461 length:894 start_codon:yes stop_codon:yes gene_type:complete